jgi:hypothetical protein
VSLTGGMSRACARAARTSLCFAHPNAVVCPLVAHHALLCLVCVLHPVWRAHRPARTRLPLAAAAQVHVCAGCARRGSGRAGGTERGRAVNAGAWRRCVCACPSWCGLAHGSNTMHMCMCVFMSMCMRARAGALTLTAAC